MKMGGAMVCVRVAPCAWDMGRDLFGEMPLN